MSDKAFKIDRAKLYAVARGAFGGAGGGSGQPDPDHPLKPGPWDPVIRVALKDVLRFGPDPIPWRHGPHPIPWGAGPLPDPWLSAVGLDLLTVIARRFPAIWDVIGRAGEEVSLNPQPLPPVEIGRLGDLVALNPQPLPPRALFTSALSEALVARAGLLADVGAATAGEERGIIIVGGYVSGLVDEYCGNGFRWRWPFPGPPPWWFRGELTGHDLIGLGAGLDLAAKQTADRGLARALDDASGKLAQVGLERL